MVYRHVHVCVQILNYTHNVQFLDYIFYISNDLSYICEDSTSRTLKNEFENNSINNTNL